jgi:pimeloyl-ACP methyl ester carboxylesterase
VLAGHSFGGLYVLTFTARYPDEVAGLVLVDSTEPGSAATPATSPDNEDSYNIMGRASALLSVSARLGVGRLLGRLTYGSLPPRARDESIASAATPDHVQSTIDEYMQGSASADQAASLGDFGGKPLVVLTAASGSDAEWKAAQDDLASLSTNSAHRVVDDASHGEMLLDEDAAAATTQAILDVVSSVRSGRRLVQ